MPQVNPAVLIWARESAGLTLDEAAEKLSINAARGVEGPERLRAYEEGRETPTRQLLVRMSKQYRRPLLALYMSEPPRKGDRGEDFRTLPQRANAGLNILVDTLIRDVRARQSMVRTLLEDAGEANRLPFVGSAAIGASITTLVRDISRVIQVTTDQYHAAATVEEGFLRLRTGAENAGIFVLLIGNLGSYHTAIDVEIFRGFALADPVAPFVVVNDQDAKAAWAFTLMHELAHLWLGATGVSGQYAESRLEQYCNDVASEMLLPTAKLADLRINQSTTAPQALARIRDFSTFHNLSGTMVAYRLYRANAISLETWQELRRWFLEQWISNRARARQEARDQEGGPDYYVVRRHRVGSALLQLARRSMAEGLLTPTKAGRLLGVKPMNVYELIGNQG